MALITAEQKAAKEREVFRNFSNFLNETDIWLNIESRNPPEPDLLCQHLSHGYIAFELVAITDPLIARVNAGYAKEGEYSFNTSDPTERIIRKKLKRKYQSTHPIELLAYNDLLVITPEDIIISKILSWADALSHPFQRVWFMGEYNAYCIWEVSKP